MPGVPELRVRQTAPTELDIRIASVTPNLKTTRIRIDGGDWRSLNDGRLIWKLNGGVNRLAVCTRNVRDVDGPVVLAAVNFNPIANQPRGP
jgi:hypothetical protein